MRPHPPHRRRSGRPHLIADIARACICIAAVVTLVLAVHHGVEITAAERSPTSVSAWKTFDRQQECIYRAIRSDLPKGAAIYINPNDGFTAQILAELSTLWAVPQPTPTSAGWTISEVPGTACSGVTLKVRRS